MKTIVVANHKGGVGKTTTSLSLGAGLHRKGFKVLLVDLDPQLNLSYTCGIYKHEDLKGCCLFDSCLYDSRGRNGNGYSTFNC